MWRDLKIFLKSGCCSVFQSFPTLCNPMDCSTSGFPVLHHLLEFAQTHVHWVRDAIQQSHPLSPSSPPAFNLSQHQGPFSNESAVPIRWPKYWNFSFSISPSNEYSGLISFRTDWLDLLAFPFKIKKKKKRNKHECSHSSVIKSLWTWGSLLGMKQQNQHRPQKASCQKRWWIHEVLGQSSSFGVWIWVLDLCFSQGLHWKGIKALWTIYFWASVWHEVCPLLLSAKKRWEPPFAVIFFFFNFGNIRTTKGTKHDLTQVCLA